MTTLDDFFAACEKHSFTYDTLTEAVQAAHYLLKGSAVLKRICIVAEEMDGPDHLVEDNTNDLLFIRARDLVPNEWRLVTTQETAA